MLSSADNKGNHRISSHRENNSVGSHWCSLHPPQQSHHAVLTAEPSATVSLDNRGLAYADGFFTTMAIRDGEILWVDYHWQRLDSHAKALQLDIPKQSLLADLRAHAQRLESGMMKVIVTRAVQAIRGYGFSADSAGSACEIWLKTMATASQTLNDNITNQAIIQNDKVLLPDGRPIVRQTPTRAVCLNSQLACLPPTLAGLKTLNRLDNVLASGELQALKNHQENVLTDTALIVEGLVRDMGGSWVEGTMSNVFYQLSEVKDSATAKQDSTIGHEADYFSKGQWYTPPMMQSGVAGVMRQVIIDGLANSNTPVILRPLSTEDLPHLSQMFFCNAVRGVMPVSALTLLLGEVVELG